MFFFTATINSWKTLLFDDRLKQIIVDSLDWLHRENKARTHGFVIMPNHIHLLWSRIGKVSEQDNETALLSFTAHQFKKYLTLMQPLLLNEFVSTQSDREFHFWERRSRTTEIMTREIAEQKLDYMHNNPLTGRWHLVSLPEDYQYSSAAFYILNTINFTFLTHYMDYI